MQKYILVQWPDSQMLMDHPRFNECLFIDNIDGHNDVGSSAYMCPEDLYNKIFFDGNKANHYAEELSELRQRITNDINASFDKTAEVHVEQILNDGTQELDIVTYGLKRDKNGDVVVEVCVICGDEENETYDDNKNYNLDNFSLNNLIEILRQLCSNK